MTTTERLSSTSVDFEQQLIRRAWEDEQFAELLRHNPRRAIAEETGVELPGNVNVQVHQQDRATLHLVVPAKLSPRFDLSENFPIALYRDTSWLCEDIQGWRTR